MMHFAARKGGVVAPAENGVEQDALAGTPTVGGGFQDLAAGFMSHDDGEPRERQFACNARIIRAAHAHLTHAYAHLASSEFTPR